MWKIAIENGLLKLSTTQVAQAKSIYPNLLAWIDGRPRVGAIVAFQSETDFALGKAGLDYVTCAKAEGRCQSASDRDPGSASKRDPTLLRFERLALAPSELVWVEETGRARVVA
jgi:hypothetical protein